MIHRPCDFLFICWSDPSVQVLADLLHFLWCHVSVPLNRSGLLQGIGVSVYQPWLGRVTSLVPLYYHTNTAVTDGSQTFLLSDLNNGQSSELIQQIHKGTIIRRRSNAAAARGQRSTPSQALLTQ